MLSETRRQQIRNIFPGSEERQNGKSVLESRKGTDWKVCPTLEIIFNGFGCALCHHRDDRTRRS